jgi:hypothetical protein
LRSSASNTRSTFGACPRTVESLLRFIPQSLLAVIAHAARVTAKLILATQVLV